MQERSKTVLKRSCLAVSVLWIVGAVWLQWDQLTAGNKPEKPEDSVSYRILRECSGTFRERSECASEIMSSHEQQKFNRWLIILGILFGPPVLVYIVYSQQMHAIEDKEEAERQLHRLEQLADHSNKLRAETIEYTRQQEVSKGRHDSVRNAERDANREKRRKPHRVLLISEDFGMTHEVTTLLFASGYTVVSSDLKDAFLGFDKINFDIIVSELHFDGHNKAGGIKETLDVMRKRNKKLRIVCISPECAHLTAEQRKVIARQVGVDGMIGKPFESEDLIALLDELLEPEDKDAADKLLQAKVEKAMKKSRSV